MFKRLVVSKKVKLLVSVIVLGFTLFTIYDFASAGGATDTEFASLKTDVQKMTTGNLVGSLIALFVIFDIAFVGFYKKEWTMVVISLVLGLGLAGVVWTFITARFTLLVTGV